MEKFNEVGVFGSRYGQPPEGYSLLRELSAGHPKTIESFFREVDVVNVVGGDGTLQWVFGQLIGMNHQGLVVVEKGGGANTFYHGIQGTNPVEEYPFKDRFSSDQYKVYHYRPPVARWADSELVLSYLAGNAPVSVITEKWKEFFGRLPGMKRVVTENAAFFYNLGGVGALLSVAPLISKEPKSLALIFTEDGENYQRLTGPLMAAEIIAVPAYGPYGLNIEIPPDKLCLLELGEDSQWELFKKSACGFKEITRFSQEGFQRLIDLGLINTRIIVRARVLPNYWMRNNTSFSGELMTMDKSYTVERAESGLWVAIKRDE